MEEFIMKIIPGPSSQILGLNVAISLNIKPSLVKFKKFPDGEQYVKIEDNVADKDVLLIQTTSFPQNDNLIELFFMIEAIINMNPKSLSLIIPYFAYSRQDKRFLEGESLSSKLICKIIDSISSDRAKFFVSFDIHSRIIENFFKNYSFINLSAIPLIAELLKEYSLLKPLIIAPDKGAQDKAKELADLLASDYTYLEKERSKITGEIKTSLKDLSVKNRDVVFIDDIISTGGTMVKGIEMARSQGARDIYAACTHPLLISDAKTRILNAGAKKIIGTDAIPSECSSISLSTSIVKFIKKNFS
ncbi:MAG: ribose-phosphate diphosphokinase [Candidatus Lokiarchaeota archaeon]|nr:ribose-phosphate diphosphokinase [Candidatus Lokiarchaeota archaeon]